MAGFQLTYLICCRARSPSCFSTPFHHIFSCSGLHSQVPFFFFFKHFSKNCLIFSRQFLYSFNVSSSTSLYCCLLLPTTSSASPQLRPLRGSGGSPPGRDAGVPPPQQSRCTAPEGNAPRQRYRAQGNAGSFRQTGGTSRTRTPQGGRSPRAHTAGGEGRGGGRAASARPALRGAGREGSGAAQGERRPDNGVRLSGEARGCPVQGQELDSTILRIFCDPLTSGVSTAQTLNEQEPLEPSQLVMTALLSQNKFYTRILNIHYEINVDLI